MFNRVLVPLDGSARAEHAIPIAARIARATGGSVLLLRVVRDDARRVWALGAPHTSAATCIARQHSHASEYLAHITERDELAEADTETAVADGHAGAQIVSIARDRALDLIVMCGRSRASLDRHVRSSVVEEVCRHAPMPVLVTSEDAPSALQVDGRVVPAVSVFVPLDGSMRSESAVEPAMDLARALGGQAQAALHLVRPVDMSLALRLSDESGDDAGAIYQDAVADARLYLARVVSRLRAGAAGELRMPIHIMTARGSDAGEALATATNTAHPAEESGFAQRYDIIAMATGGRSGWGRWMRGNVRERVMRTTRLPVLVVRSSDAASHDDRVKRDATAVSTAPWTMPLF